MEIPCGREVEPTSCQPSPELKELLGQNPFAEHAIVALKPGVVTEAPHYQERVFGFFAENGIDVTGCRDVQLTVDSALALYRDVFELDVINDLEYGVGWKIDLLEYLLSGETRFFLVAGSDGLEEGVMSLRSAIRGEIYRANGNKKTVRNVIHVSEPDELTCHGNIIFSGMCCE